VNLASRLVSVAQPGQTVISAQLRSELVDAVHADIDDLGLRYVKHLEKPRCVSVQAPADLSQIDLEAALHDARWTVAEVYKHWIPDIATGPKRLARHFTAELDREYLPWLKTNPYGIRWELALPFRDAETAARAVQVGGTGPTRAADSFRPATGKLFRVARHHERAAAPGSRRQARRHGRSRRRIWGATHGSHVLDVAGGCIHPLTGRSDDGDDDDENKK